jgi:hypothetical protein
MSALGQKQTSRLVRVMSALPPKADMETRQSKSSLVLAAMDCDVRFGSEADIHPPSVDFRFTPKSGHGNPPGLLRCELAAVGSHEISIPC